MSSPTLPQEIWWLVSEEFTQRRDFGSLFNCALVSRSHANIALPLLYSIHDSSPASTGDTDVIEIKYWTSLWRSILTSCFGKTLFPYCLWIRALNLGNLHTLLEDLTQDRFRVRDIDINYEVLRQSFFSPPLQGLYITRKRARTFMDIKQIVINAGDVVTSFIKKAAEDEDKTVMLTGLEGYHLSSTHLQDWVSRLSHLSSLTVRDGSVLTADVSRIIRASCPLFKEVVCHYCMGDQVDEGLAGFISGLAPNTLQSFTIMSINTLGEHTFQALPNHSESLRVLSLCAEMSGIEALHFLKGCNKLREVSIEVNGGAGREFKWERDRKEEFQQVISWLSECHSLTSLELSYVPGAPLILNRILRVPEIRLVSLGIRVLHSSLEYEAVGLQPDLENLVIRSDGEFSSQTGFGPSSHSVLIDAICRCTKLRKLDLMNELMGSNDIAQIVKSLPQLDDFAFDGDLITDDLLLPLSGFRLLKTLNINALSCFTFQGVLQFISDMRYDENANHEGLRIYIMRQYTENKFSEHQERTLTDEVARRFGGKFEITYDRDPDDLHESDFSD